MARHRRRRIPPTPGQPHKEPMMTPLALGLIGKDGGDMPLVLDGRAGSNAASSSWRAEPKCSSSPPSPSGRSLCSTAAGGAGEAWLPLEPGERCFLAARDSDPFNRWQALQTPAMTLLTANVAALRKRQAPRDDAGLMAALGAILADDKLGAGFRRADAGAAERGRHCPRNRPRRRSRCAIFTARRKLLAAIGEKHNAALSSTYARMNTGGHYSPDAGSAGRRALKERLPRSHGGDRSQRSNRVRRWRSMNSADNMTDRMAALETLAQHDRPERGCGAR